jgi:phosphomannomutase
MAIGSCGHVLIMEPMDNNEKNFLPYEENGEFFYTKFGGEDDYVSVS